MRDRYFHGIDLDFSKCVFVFSYNDLTRVNPVLLDRIKRIRVNTPSLEERCEILKRHIVPRVARRLNTDLTISDAGIAHIVKRGDARQEGMRGCEKDVDDVLALAQLRRAQDGGAGASSRAVSEDDVVHWCRASADAVAAPPPPMMYT